MISVIVPIYNAAPFLRKCIDSLIVQNCPGLEILLINDGSLDNSLDICNEYANKYGMIKVIDKPNGGVSDARNCGIQNAVNEYVMFVDADDWLSDDAVEVCLPFIPEYDIVRFSANIVYHNRVAKCDVGNFRNADVLTGAVISRNTIVACWAGIFRKELFHANKIYFDTSLDVGEDWLVIASLVSKCKNIKSLHEKFCYFYNQTNEKSCTNTINSKKMITQYEVLLRIRQLILTGYDFEFSYTKRMLILEAIKRFGIEKAKDILKDYHETFTLLDLQRALKSDLRLKMKLKLLRFYI